MDITSQHNIIVEYQSRPADIYTCMKNNPDDTTTKCWRILTKLSKEEKEQADTYLKDTYGQDAYNQYRDSTEHFYDQKKAIMAYISKQKLNAKKKTELQPKFNAMKANPKIAMTNNEKAAFNNLHVNDQEKEYKRRQQAAENARTNKLTANYADRFESFLEDDVDTEAERETFKKLPINAKIEKYTQYLNYQAAQRANKLANKKLAEQTHKSWLPRFMQKKPLTTRGGRKTHRRNKRKTVRRRR
jgi:hypothetical protein